MQLFVAVTDYDWYLLHASKAALDEVNFWRPSAGTPFKALSLGEPFLFKLHSPRNFICGGGFFTKFIQLPLTWAWESPGFPALDRPNPAFYIHGDFLPSLQLPAGGPGHADRLGGRGPGGRR